MYFLTAVTVDRFWVNQPAFVGSEIHHPKKRNTVQRQMQTSPEEMVCDCLLKVRSIPNALREDEIGFVQSLSLATNPILYRHNPAESRRRKSESIRYQSKEFPTG